MTPDEPEFECKIHDHGETAVIELSGELDLATVPEAEAALPGRRTATGGAR